MKKKDWNNYPNGEWCVLRSDKQGCLFGKVLHNNGQRVVLEQARQLYEWQSKFVLLELAAFGPKGANNRFGHPSAEPIVATEVCGLLPVGPGVKELFDNVKPQEF